VVCALENCISSLIDCPGPSFGRGNRGCGTRTKHADLDDSHLQSVSHVLVNNRGTS